MPESPEDLKKRLARLREIKISVTGRKSGATITIPVWFVLEADKLYLLPSMDPTPNGSRTCRRTGS